VPYEQNNHRTHRCTNQTGSLIGAVPADRLTDNPPLKFRVHAGLSVVMTQVFVQRSGARFFEQRLEHHVLATAFGETGTVLFAQRTYSGVAVLLVDFAAFVTVAAIKAAMPLCHSALLWIA
jgi:hypothetical protein